MKKLACITLFFLFSFMCNGQTGKDIIKSQSNVEKFSDRSGILLQKEFEDVGTIKKCKIQIARFEDLISNQKSKGVRFEYTYVSSYSSDIKLALLDEDEIDALIKSLKLIQEKILPKNVTNYTEVSFKSRSGFDAGCFSSKGSWSVYMKLEKYDSNSYIFMDKDDINELLSVLQQAKEKL